MKFVGVATSSSAQFEEARGRRKSLSDDVLQRSTPRHDVKKILGLCHGIGSMAFLDIAAPIDQSTRLFFFLLMCRLSCKTF